MYFYIAKFIIRSRGMFSFVFLVWLKRLFVSLPLSLSTNTKHFHKNICFHLFVFLLFVSDFINCALITFCYQPIVCCFDVFLILLYNIKIENGRNKITTPFQL